MVLSSNPSQEKQAKIKRTAPANSVLVFHAHDSGAAKDKLWMDKEITGTSTCNCIFHSFQQN